VRRNADTSQKFAASLTADVIRRWAGVAGSAAAYHLAARGRQVKLLEASANPAASPAVGAWPASSAEVVSPSIFRPAVESGDPPGWRFTGGPGGSRGGGTSWRSPFLDRAQFRAGSLLRPKPVGLCRSTSRAPHAIPVGVPIEPERRSHWRVRTEPGQHPCLAPCRGDRRTGARSPASTLPLGPPSASSPAPYRPFVGWRSWLPSQQCSL